MKILETKELNFEIVNGQASEDMFGVDFVVGVGTDDNDDNITEDVINNEDFRKYFTSVCENVFTLTEQGEEVLTTEQSVIDWCKSIGMIQT